MSGLPRHDVAGVETSNYFRSAGRAFYILVPSSPPH